MRSNPPEPNQAHGYEILVRRLRWESLGFSNSQETQGNAQDQARLDRRSHMLKLHQRMGLITLAPLIATMSLSSGHGSWRQNA